MASWEGPVEDGMEEGEGVKGDGFPIGELFGGVGAVGGAGDGAVDGSGVGVPFGLADGGFEPVGATNSYDIDIENDISPRLPSNISSKLGGGGKSLTSVRPKQYPVTTSRHQHCGEQHLH